MQARFCCKSERGSGAYRHVHPLISPQCVYAWLSRIKLLPVIWRAQPAGPNVNTREHRGDDGLLWVPRRRACTVHRTGKKDL